MLSGFAKLVLAGCAVAGCVAVANKRSQARAELLAKAHHRDRLVNVIPIDSSSPVPGAWAVPIYANKGPWPVRAWWPRAAGVPYAYSDEHNMAD